jgi:hypothetical protein
MDDTPPGLTIIPSEEKGRKERTPAQKEAIQKALARLAEKRKMKQAQPPPSEPSSAAPVIKARRVYKKRTPAPAPAPPSGFPTLPTINAPSLPAPPPIATAAPAAPDYMSEIQALKNMIGSMTTQTTLRSVKPKKRVVVVEDSSEEEEEEEIQVVKRKKTSTATAVPIPAPSVPPKKYSLDIGLFSRH